MVSYWRQVVTIPGDDGVVRRLEADGHEQADVLVADSTQNGRVANELVDLGLVLVTVGVYQHVAMPTASAGQVTVSPDIKQIVLLEPQRHCASFTHARCRSHILIIIVCRAQRNIHC